MAKQPKPIPEGYHTLTPNIVVNGADKAIDFYRRAFNAKERGGRFRGPDGKVMHAELEIGDSVLMLMDENPEMGSQGPTTLGGTPANFYLYLKNVDTAWKQAIDAGGKEVMPLSDMFWGDRVGRLKDPFGHSWSLAQHVKDLTPEEMTKAGEEFFAQTQGAR